MSKVLKTQPGSIQPVAELTLHPSVRRGFEYIDSAATTLTRDHISICEIPAPPFLERTRAEFMMGRFEEFGLSNVHIDEVGNLIGVRPGVSDDPTIVLSAHLDTVFPAGTETKVKKLGNRLLAPGISDDGCGLAALFAMNRTLNAADIRTRGTLIFIATVGEEGEGNLRGTRYLFGDSPLAKKIDSFVSLDGPGVERITHQALGSRRYRVTVTGPGGHSWGDFGIVNPIHASGRVIARFSAYPVPETPRTTFNIGMIRGGKSVNSISQSASMDVDLRSVSNNELNKIEVFLKKTVESSIAEENARHAHTGTRMTFTSQMIGNRPSGETPVDTRIVQVAIEASRALGINIRLDRSSTDSNIPISLGLPAVTLGVGGYSGNTHSLEEWFDPTGRELGLKRTLLVALGLVGIAN